MKKKISVLTIAIILTLILFGISTYMQKKLINYEPTVKCYVAVNDIEESEKITPEKIKEISIPINLVINMNTIQNIEETNGMYAKSKIYGGQVIVKNQIDTKENLSIFESEANKEKISIKIKSAENAVSYRIKENSKINVYATLRTEYANNVFPDSSRQFIGSENDGYCNIKVLENVKVLGVFDNMGVEITSIGDENAPDTIMINVTHEEARDINMIRELATFNVTEVGEAETNENISN